MEIDVATLENTANPSEQPATAVDDSASTHTSPDDKSQPQSPSQSEMAPQEDAQSVQVDDPEEQSSSPFKTDKMKRLEAKLRLNPFDVDSWTLLIAEAHAAKDVDLIRECYERVLQQFPTSVRILCFALFYPLPLPFAVLLFSKNKWIVRCRRLLFSFGF
jgi:hypothetical protein